MRLKVDGWRIGVTLLAAYVIVGSTMGLINPSGGTETVTVISPPRLVSLPAVVIPVSTVVVGTLDPVEPVGATMVVTVPEVVVVTQTLDDFLDAQFALAEASDVWARVEAGEVGEETRGQFIPTLENAISPGFTELQLATRYMSPEEFRFILELAGWPEEEWDQAYLVARCESPAGLSRRDIVGWLDLLGVGPGFERGLFQIHPMWFAPEAAKVAELNRVLFPEAEFDLWNPVHNAMAALTLWRNGRWAHWECFNQGLAELPEETT